MVGLEQSLEKVKIRIMLAKDTAFISSVMLNLGFEWTDQVPTASTNGTRIRINPTYWDSLDKDERIFLALHETWHVCFDHIARAHDANFIHKKANLAGDYEINDMLIRAGYKMPKGGRYEKKYENMHFEKIYHLLPDPPEDYEPDIEELSGDEQTEAEEKIGEILVQAAVAASMAAQDDSIPASIQRHIEDINSPKLPWETILRNYLNDYAKDDYSWSKRNRRYSDIYLPSLYSEHMGEIRVYGDQSGSFGDKEFTMSVRELQFVQELMLPKRMVYRAFTTGLTPEEVFNEGEKFEPVARVSGGTAIEPVIEDIIKHSPQVAIVFTDGYFRTPTFDGLHTDIIWCIIGNKEWTCDVGKIIHINMKDYK